MSENRMSAKDLALMSFMDEKPSATSVHISEVRGIMDKRIFNEKGTEFTDHLNKILVETPYKDEVRNNSMGYIKMVNEGLGGRPVRISEYLNAVRFSTYVIAGHTKSSSWRLVFPDRFEKLRGREGESKLVSKYSTVYASGLLVSTLLKQAIVPSWILNQDIYQGSINKLYNLAMKAKSEKVQSDSAKALIDHLKVPEAAMLDIDIKVNNNTTIDLLSDHIDLLSEKQIELIEGGSRTLKGVVESKIINPEESLDQ